MLGFSEFSTYETYIRHELMTNLGEIAEENGYIKTYKPNSPNNSTEYTYILHSNVRLLEKTGKIKKGIHQGWEQRQKTINGKTFRVYVKL
jgi:hypothetical protein